MKTFSITILLLSAIFLSKNIFAQEPFFKNLQGYSNFKVSAYAIYKGGLGLSFGYGFWVENKKVVEAGVNSSINLILGRSNLGNRNRLGSRLQVATVLSPIVTFRLNDKIGYYEDINSFYFGNANALRSRYKNSISFGTNVVLSPKTNTSMINGKIIEQNIYASKNRFQQLVYIGFRFGADTLKRSPCVLKFNFYEDFIVFRNLLPLFFQNFADHNDRFFTGGGNLELKKYIAGFQPIGVTLYGDVYTGNFERDMFDFPDIYDVNEEKFGGNSSKKRRTARYVAQEPSQKLLNVGRFFGIADMPLSDHKYAPTLQLIFGQQGGSSGMGLQDAIHDISTIDKINPNQNPQILHIPKGQDKQSFERLHHFYPAVKEKRLIGGIGLKSL